MHNTINNVSFGADLKILTRINNKSSVAKAQEIFRNATTDYPNDNLYIISNSLGETILSLLNSSANRFAPIKDIGTKNVDKQIGEMGLNKFAEKLITMFKSLKLHEEANTKLTKIEHEILRLTKVMELNINIAGNWKAEGKQHIADRYTVLAKNNEGKINKLKSEEQIIKSRYNKKIDDLCQIYKEMIQLKIR